MPTSSSASHDHGLALLLGLRELVHLEALGDDLADGEPRRQRAIGVLEHDLHLPAQRAHLAAAQAVDARAVELDGALALDQPQQRQAERGLAGAALADDADRMALADIERNAVDRLHVIDHAPQQAGLDREPHLDVAAAHHRRRVRRGLHRVALGLGLQQAAGVFMLRIVEHLSRSGPARRSALPSSRSPAPPSCARCRDRG